MRWRGQVSLVIQNYKAIIDEGLIYFLSTTKYEVLPKSMPASMNSLGNDD